MLLRLFSFLKFSSARLITFYLFSLYWTSIANRYKKERKKKGKPRLMFGPCDILNNKLWSNALKTAGYNTETVVRSNSEIINRHEDFDKYFEQIIKDNYRFFPYFLRYLLSDFFLFDYFLKNYDILHKDLSHLVFKDENLWNKEIDVLKKFGIKIIIIPFGGDFLQYSTIKNYSLKHVLMSTYPQSKTQESQLKKICDYWTYNSDTFIASNILDGKLKWDLIPFVNLCLDIKNIAARKKYSSYDGINGEVVIVHSPNHRLIKGSEFIIGAINELKKEGLKIRFVLIEKIKNTEVRRILTEEADILVEQIIVGYALSGVEGMAFGVPTISNLENEEYLRMYRRYSYLNECPVFSATPETIKERIKTLVLNPELRKTLGEAGRKYAEKYHSEESAIYMFERIYDKIWYGKEVDLINMYHPMMANSYNNQSPRIDHPLKENKLPSSYFKKPEEKTT